MKQRRHDEDNVILNRKKVKWLDGHFLYTKDMHMIWNRIDLLIKLTLNKIYSI